MFWTRYGQTLDFIFLLSMISKISSLKNMKHRMCRFVLKILSSTKIVVNGAYWRLHVSKSQVYFTRGVISEFLVKTTGDEKC